MEQYSQYLMWMRNKHFLKYSKYSWEEQAFAEDAMGPLGGFVWPPRSYSCSFCQREFRSAQALGGHMNVHRRDRARLKQSSSVSLQNPSQPQQVCTSDSSNPSTFVASPSRVSALSTQENFSKHDLEEYQKNIASCQKSTREEDDFGVPTNLCICLNMGVGEEEDDGNCKRRKISTDGVLPLQFLVKPCSEKRFFWQSEVLGLKTSSMEDIDLELRLGNPAIVN